MADSKKVIAKQFLHSCNIRSKHGSVVLVKEKLKFEDNTTKPNIVWYENPKRSFYITQPRHRTYNFKPEYELVSKLDKYTVPDSELQSKLAELQHFGPGYHRNDQLFKSPYIFGADITIEALIRMRYLDNYPENDLLPTIGFLDIETSIDTGQIIIISYLYGETVYTAILDSFFFEEKDKVRTPIDIVALENFVKENLADRTDNINFKYVLKVFNHEIKLISWIMKQVHEADADFISIWNMNFDIPKIISCINSYGYDPKIFFHNPRVPKDYAYFKYYTDQQKKSHFTLKWHWLYSSCGSQFVDSMGLYSQNRRTQGYLDKYSLDNILDKHLKIGKLPLISGSHVIMQRHHFKEYIVYNIFDVIGLKLLEARINDFVSMHMLIGPSPVSKFASQIVRSTNDMYYDLINKGKVLSSKSGDDPFLKFDQISKRVGGAVLSSDRVRGVGISLTI